jgi:glycerol-3-phosphate acyltransferase PlsX
MGGDHAPAAPVAGAVLAADALDVRPLLVGPEEVVRAELARLEASAARLEIVHAPDVIGMDETAPAAAVRRSPDSSISRGMSLVRHGEAEAFVTVGHTGATLAGALFRLGRLPGVRRPALATPFPTLAGPCVLLDVGANADVRPEYLLQFAVMGAAYAERVLGIAEPRVGLLSIGEERGKGSQVVQDALPLLESSGLDFIGNVEGGDIPAGATDVVVTDGFTGNVLIKFAEGVAELVQHLLRDAATSDPLALVGGLLSRRAMRRARQRIDYRGYGGALLLGVRGVVVIGHGRSDPEAVKRAIEVAARAVDGGLVAAIEQGLEAAEAVIDTVASDTAKTDSSTEVLARGTPVGA